MAVHDAYARVTPYELALPGGAAGPDEGGDPPGEIFAREHFGAIREEARARGVDAADPAAFPMLMAAGRALRELRGPDESPERIREHGALLYHAYHFREAGCPVLLLDTGLVRRLVEGGPSGQGGAGVWTPRVPRSAAYVQLPQHQISVSPEGDAPPESVDGFFWTAAGDAVSFLAATGLRSDRPGFGAIALPAVPLADAPVWIDEAARPDGHDFASDLPGAELEGLYEVSTAGELLKLAGRILRLLDGGPCVTRDHEPARPERGPRPSRLPYARLTLE